MRCCRDSLFAQNGGPYLQQLFVKIFLSRADPDNSMSVHPSKMFLVIFVLPTPINAFSIDSIPAVLTTTDPFRFSSPSFGIMPAHEGFFVQHGSILTGFACYAVGMCALTAWDEHVLPRMMEPAAYKKWTGMTHPSLKESPSLENAVLFGLPTLEEIMDACVLIKTADNALAHQFICAMSHTSEWDSEDEYDHCEVSEEWSAHYGVEVATCRRARR